MQSHADTVEDYLGALPADRREAVSAVRDVVNAHLPEGYLEQWGWGTFPSTSWARRSR